MSDPISPERRRWFRRTRSSSEPLDDLSDWAPASADSVADGPRRPRTEPDGPPPGEPPRPVPESLTGGGYVPLLVGGIFIAVGIPFVIIAVVGLLFGNTEFVFFLFPGIHVIVGTGLVGGALRSRRRRRRIAAEGHVVVGTIDAAEKTSKLKVNGRKANLIRYHYEVFGAPHRNERVSMKNELAAYLPGDRIWVVYDPDRPDHSVEWPPT